MPHKKKPNDYVWYNESQCLYNNIAICQLICQPETQKICFTLFGWYSSLGVELEKQ